MGCVESSKKDFYQGHRGRKAITRDLWSWRDANETLGAADSVVHAFDFIA